MTLKDTVSRILSKEVTKAEAKKFAYDQYGVLCAHIRSEAFKKLLKEKEEDNLMDFGQENTLNTISV